MNILAAVPLWPTLTALRLMWPKASSKSAVLVIDTVPTPQHQRNRARAHRGLWSTGDLSAFRAPELKVVPPAP